MKKFTRYSIYTATAFIVIGAIMTGISLLLGGTSQISEMIDKGFPALSFSGTSLNDLDFNTNYPVFSGSQDTISLGNSSTITEVNIRLCSGKMYLKESTDEQLYIDSHNCSSFQAYTTDNVLTITAFKQITGTSDNTLTLYVPKDFMPDNWNIEVAAGSFVTDYINSRSNINIDVAAGELICHSLSTQDLFVDIGSASAVFSNAAIKKASVNVGAGAFEYNGIITDDLDIDCAAGNASLLLTDSYQSHNYDIECALGDVTIGETDFSALAIDNYINNQSTSTFSLSCGMGEINITFAN